MRNKDFKRLLLEALMNGKKCSQRNFGDHVGTSRLASYKRRLVQDGFPVETKMIYSPTQYGIYHL